MVSAEYLLAFQAVKKGLITFENLTEKQKEAVRKLAEAEGYILKE